MQDWSFLIIIAVASGRGGDDKTPTAADTSSSQSSAPSTNDKAARPVTSEPAKLAAPDLTAGQANALKAAENYLSFTPFSRKGLIRQLSSSAGDGYSVKDATYAADHVKVNWNEQAAKAAKNYLGMTSFSRQADPAADVLCWRRLHGRAGDLRREEGRSLTGNATSGPSCLGSRARKGWPRPQSLSRQSGYAERDLPS